MWVFSSLSYNHNMMIIGDSCKWRLYYKCVVHLALALALTLTFACVINYEHKWCQNLEHHLLLTNWMTEWGMLRASPHFLLSRACNSLSLSLFLFLFLWPVNKVGTPSSLVRERGRERQRERDRGREREKERGRERESEGERGGARHPEYGCYWIDRCLGTF